MRKKNLKFNGQRLGRSSGPGSLAAAGGQPSGQRGPSPGGGQPSGQRGTSPGGGQPSGRRGTSLARHLPASASRRPTAPSRRQSPAWLAPAAVLVFTLILYGVLTAASRSRSGILENRHLDRDGYGGDQRQYELVVEGLPEAGELPVTVQVGPRIYSEEEAEDVFLGLMDSMEERIRGENASLMEVRSHLELPKWFQEEGVRASWYPSDPDLMDTGGKLRSQVEQPREMTLTVALSDGIHKSTYEMPVRLVPQDRTREEKLVSDFLKELEIQDTRQAQAPGLVLPETFQDHVLHYRLSRQEGYGAILLLGILAALLLAARQQSEKKDQEKKRERELLLDYADIVSKLMVLTGAGLTTRNAWERMVRDYENALAIKKARPRPAYEEMALACTRMGSGMSEGEAYREFGRRCKVQCYLKLSSLLEQNRRAGTKNLRAMLETEMADALEQRKNLARRLGEEAGTRLLLPLFLMLGIVMVMIMVPAMMSMG